MEKIFECIDFDFALRFFEGLQRFLGDKCEIVIHDFRKGYDSSLVYEFNAQLSGRKVGDSPRGGMITNAGKDITPLKDSMIFFYPGAKGQLFKSCTTLIADADKKIVGSVCLNLDISDFLIAQGAIQNFIQYRNEDVPQDTDSSDSSAGIITKNVDEMLTCYINESEDLLGKPASLMSKEEKIRALDFLDQKGILKISKASNLLCSSFQISRYTLYSYLEEARALREKTKTE